MRHRLNSTLRTSALPLTPTAPDLLADVVVVVGLEVVVLVVLVLFAVPLPVLLLVLLLVPVVGLAVLLVPVVVPVVVVDVASACLFTTPVFAQSSRYPAPDRE
jgi:hypothetical protein